MEYYYQKRWITTTFEFWRISRREKEKKNQFYLVRIKKKIVLFEYNYIITVSLILILPLLCKKVIVYNKTEQNECCITILLYKFALGVLNFCSYSTAVGCLTLLVYLRKEIYKNVYKKQKNVWKTKTHNKMKTWKTANLFRIYILSLSVNSTVTILFIISISFKQEKKVLIIFGLYFSCGFEGTIIIKLSWWFYKICSQAKSEVKIKSKTFQVSIKLFYFLYFFFFL